MLKKLIIGIVAIMSFARINAQQVIEGRVIDEISKAPIEGVHIFSKEHQQGTYTNALGTFSWQIEPIPDTIILSHIAYLAKKITREELGAKSYSISLIPKNELLDEIVITGEKEIISLSEKSKESIQEFELKDDKIYQLNFVGTFKKRTLSVSDINGNDTKYLSLQGVKNIEGLYKGCNEIIYLETSSHAYPILDKTHFFTLGQKIQMDTFNYFFKPCKSKIGGDFYYLFNSYNGLMKTVTKMDNQSGAETVVKVIADYKRLDLYRRDVGAIKRGEAISTMRVNNYDLNQKLRGYQAESAFLVNNFHKSKYPVQIFELYDSLYIFNHPDAQLEKWNGDTTAFISNLTYPKQKDWSKKVLKDEVTNKIFTLLYHNKGVTLNEINILTGEINLSALLETPIFYANQIRVHNNEIFYVKENKIEGYGLELVKVRL